MRLFVSVAAVRLGTVYAESQLFVRQLLVASRSGSASHRKCNHVHADEPLEACSLR